jgi:undecaprenyl-diphosphatase
MTFIQAVILGIVQGLTEFLPISSTAHIRIVPALLGWHFYGGTTNDPGAPFTAVVQLGTTLAIVIYFWRELLHVTMAWFRGLYDRTVRGTLEYRLGWYLILATIPVGLFGVIFSNQIESGARNLWLIASMMIAFAGLLFAAEKVGRRDREEEQINGSDAAVVGAAQAQALIPGASRSGTTITAGLFRGMTR